MEEEHNCGECTECGKSFHPTDNFPHCYINVHVIGPDSIVVAACSADCLRKGVERWIAEGADV